VKLSMNLQKARVECVGESQCSLSMISAEETGGHFIWATRESDSKTCLKVDLLVHLFLNKSSVKFRSYWPFIINFIINY
jgi:hypothetical protein